MSIFLSFYLGHDASVAVSVDGNIKYRKFERIHGIKHQKGNFNFVSKALDDWKIKLKDIKCIAYSDGDRSGLGKCSKKELFCKGQLKKLGLDIKSFNIDHHFAHILSSWPVIPTVNTDYGVCIDGKGDNEKSTTVIKNLTTNPEVVYEEFGSSVGLEFRAIAGLMGFSASAKETRETGAVGIDFAGKIMGLQAYSEDQIKEFGLPKLLELDVNSNRINEYVKNYKYMSPEMFRCREMIKKGFYKTYSEWHNFWLNYILKNTFASLDKKSIISYSGGCVQNTVFNYRIKKEFPNLFPIPHCYDGGIPLGCLEFLRLYFGENPFDCIGFPYWQDDNITQRPTDKTIKLMAKMLNENKIIGWIQGSGELGPRSLGNRSILMSPINKSNKDEINKKVKMREPWRPFAGSVLQENSSSYFDMNQSKYMLYACKVLDEKKIPAITHVDRTCRIQTVEEPDNPCFYQLIKEYKNLSGVPVLLNTSFNVMGKPIVSLKKQCMEIDGVDAIVFGNEIIKTNIKI
jgi:carbamoyltransferase